MRAQQLPDFEGYTVDERLQEFRKVIFPSCRMSVVRFDSPKGARILARWYRSLERKSQS